MSKQDWRTPPAFIDAIAARFGRPTFDLAAATGEQITGVDHYFAPEQDSLRQSWASLPTPGQDSPFARVAYLNPPFANIAPWARKLTDECRWLKRWTTMLVPASIGSVWYAEHIHGRALVLGLSPRITFLGAPDPYPKDLMLVVVGFGVSGVQPWRWDKPITCACGDTDVEDPGPGHADGCPWADPEHGSDIFAGEEVAEVAE